MDLRWNKLSPNEFQQLQDLVSYSNKKLEEVLSEFEENGSLACYNRNGEVDLDGFRAFITSYLEAETPESLIRHLFSSFAKKKRSPPQEQEEEAAGPSSETASNEESPRTAPSPDHSDLFGPGTSEDPAAVVPDKSSLEDVTGTSESPATIVPDKSSLEDITERLRSLKCEYSGSETSETESPSKQACKALTSVGSLSHYESAEEIFLEMTTMSGKSSFAQANKHGGWAGMPDTEEKEGIMETSLIEGGDGDIGDLLVSLKDMGCYFSLLEGGRPQDKLEFVFRLYDTDGNGTLDKHELESIVDQMMNVAGYLGWDVTELRPILREMMTEIDYDEDGTVSLEEWIRGGMTTIPLLVLLGLDTNVKEDGNHVWRLKAFKKPAYCNFCLNILIGLGKKGFCCVYCKLIVHERCAQRTPNNCIMTYSKTKSTGQPMDHHWVEGNCSGECFYCKRAVRSYTGINGLRCRWCQVILHNECASQIPPECDLGVNYPHVVPPTAIYPIVLDRPQRTVKEVEMQVQQTQPTSFRIELMPSSKPLLVFINPKSGGRQGAEIKRKFQYHLNPKQVYSLIQDDPMQALQLFKDVQNLRVVCCGGDGTVGWILEMIDRANFASHPTIGVVPLGTGNDLARCLNWGGGYDGEPIPNLLQKMDDATMVMLDRWDIEIVTDAPPGARPGLECKTTNVVTNYFSIGVDAAICVKFHEEREKFPEKFNSRMRNKLWYFEFATSETFSASCRNLHEDVLIKCDDITLDLAGGQPLQGIAILNIPSTHGGTNLWGDGPRLGGILADYRRRFQRFRRGRDNEDGDSAAKIDLDKTMQDFGDGLIEVVGLESCLHMGQVRTGLRASGRRLAQCSTVTITTKKRLPMQIDGEPWMQDPGTIKISHRCQVPVLKAPKSKGG